MTTVRTSKSRRTLAGVVLQGFEMTSGAVLTRVSIADGGHSVFAKAAIESGGASAVVQDSTESHLRVTGGTVVAGVAMVGAGVRILTVLAGIGGWAAGIQTHL